MKKVLCMILALLLCGCAHSPKGAGTEDGPSGEYPVCEKVTYVITDASGNSQERTITYQWEDYQVTIRQYSSLDCTPQSLQGTIRYILDEEHRVVEQQSLTNDTVTNSYKYTYDQHGNQVGSVQYNGEGQETGRWEHLFEYDDQGRLTYEERGLWDDETTYVYDENGRVEKAICTNYEGVTYEFRYTYDENGVATGGVKSWPVDGKTLSERYTYTRTYYPNGQLKEEKLHSAEESFGDYISKRYLPCGLPSGSGNKQGFSVFDRTYNEKGQLVSLRGEIKETLFFYDDSGRCIRQEEWNWFESDRYSFRLPSMDRVWNYDGNTESYVTTYHSQERLQYNWNEDGSFHSVERINPSSYTGKNVTVYNENGYILRTESYLRDKMDTRHTYAYDQWGNVCQDTYESWEYDEAGALVSSYKTDTVTQSDENGFPLHIYVTSSRDGTREITYTYTQMEQWMQELMIKFIG